MLKVVGQGHFKYNAYTVFKRLNILNNKQNVIKVSVGGRISLDAWIENGARSNLEIQTGVLYFTHNSGVYIYCSYIILMSGKMGWGGGEGIFLHPSSKG